MNTQTTAVLETIDWQQRAEQAEAEKWELVEALSKARRDRRDLLELMSTDAYPMSLAESMMRTAYAEGRLREKWVALTERRPKSCEMVIAFNPDAYRHPEETSDGRISINYHVDGTWNRKGTTHWMPLPPVPHFIELPTPEPASSLPWLQACESGCACARGAVECRRCPFPVAQEGGQEA